MNETGISSAIISLSDFCNISCSYCFEKFDSRKMPSDRKRVIIESLMRKFSSSLSEEIYISFYGGEPLVYFEDIKEIVNHIDHCLDTKKISWSIATNGTLIDDAITDFLRLHSFTVQISIDGTRDIHDKHRRNRNGSGTYEEVIHTIKIIGDHCAMIGRMTVTPSTANGFCESLTHLIDLGFCNPHKRIKIDLDHDADWHDSDLETLELQMEDCARYLLDHYAAGGRAFIEPLDRALSRLESQGFCGAGKTTVHITPQGTVYPCNRLTPSHSKIFGALQMRNDLSFSTSVEVGLEKALRSAPVFEKTCSGCRAKNFCSMRCPARNFSSSGDLQKVGPSLCSFNRYIAAMALEIDTQLKVLSDRITLAETYNLPLVSH